MAFATQMLFSTNANDVPEPYLVPLFLAQNWVKKGTLKTDSSALTPHLRGVGLQLFSNLEGGLGNEEGRYLRYSTYEMHMNYCMVFPCLISWLSTGAKGNDLVGRHGDRAIFSMYKKHPLIRHRFPPVFFSGCQLFGSSTFSTSKNG